MKLKYLLIVLRSLSDEVHVYQDLARWHLSCGEETSVGHYRRNFILSLASITVCFAATGCTPSQTQRLKITVTVDDNGVLRSGSSVMQSTCHQTNNKLGGMGIGGCQIVGEAVLIDLKERGYLFMILCSRKDFLVDSGMGAIMASKPEWDAKAWTVERDNISRLVAFTDTRDSRTVFEVDPENLAATYGKGVVLKSVTARYTDEPMTSGMIKIALPWITSRLNKDLEGNAASPKNSLRTKLGGNHFISGVE